LYIGVAIMTRSVTDGRDAIDPATRAAATAGPTFRVSIASGKFQGVTNRHGPIGFRLTT